MHEKKAGQGKPAGVTEIKRIERRVERRVERIMKEELKEELKE